MVDPVTPTRDALRKIVGNDERTLIALERLFQVSGSETPDSLLSIDRRVEGLEQIPLPSSAGVRSDFKRAITGLSPDNIVFVGNRYDFPKAVSGVITLADNVTYIITSDVDLGGDRIVAGDTSSIVGFGANVSRLTSTGLTGAAIITSSYTVSLRFVELYGVDEGINFSGAPGDFIDWIGVNFLNIPTIGLIENYDNAIFINLGFINSANLTFDGTIGTIGFGDTIFSGRAGETTVIIPATATITRRFRAKFCAFVTPATGTGVDFSASASVPDEAYIYFECSFGGAGTPLSGLQNDDNKSKFTGNTGIDNSRYFANYYMTNNATPTPVVVNVSTKALGTTTANPINEKFSHSNNRATYTGAITRVFEVEAWAALASNNNNVLRLYIAKNGTAITTSFGEATANAGGRAEGIVTASVVELEQNDYIEVFVSNETGSNNITDINLNVIVSEL